MANIRTHYDNLKVVRNAPTSVIKAAYKALCQTYHPDKFQGSNQESERVMKLINASYVVLIDPVKRRLHDDWIKEQETKTDEKNRQSETEASSDQSHHQKQSTQPQANNTKSSTTAKPNIPVDTLFVIIFIIIMTWVGIRATNKTISVSAVQAEKTLSAEDIFQRANDLYIQGHYAEAFPVFRQLAEQGHPNAQDYLGFMYRNGHSVAKNYNKAVAWYRKAAEKGVASAQNSLGDMYENGQGVTKNYKKAVDWYRKSAEQGEAIGQFSLGTMYSKGRGVIQDNNQAAAWYSKAAEQGEENSITALKELKQFTMQARQSIAGIELEYPHNFQMNSVKTQQLISKIPENIKANIRSLEIFEASPSNGLTEVGLSRAVYGMEIQPSIDGAASESVQNVARLDGMENFKQWSKVVAVSGHMARQVSFEANRYGGKIGGEFLIILDTHTNTSWQLSLIFGKNKEVNPFASLNIDTERNIALSLLRSVTVQQEK